MPCSYKVVKKKGRKAAEDVAALLQGYAAANRGVVPCGIVYCLSRCGGLVWRACAASCTVCIVPAACQNIQQTYNNLLHTLATLFACRRETEELAAELRKMRQPNGRQLRVE